VRAKQVGAAVAIAAAVLVGAGWRTASATVRHASVRLGHTPAGLPIVVDVWRDASNSELAFRIRGDSDRSLLRGRTLFDVIEGQLADTTVYRHAAEAWIIVHARFGVTAARAEAALAAGETVARPAVMTVPKPDPAEYTFSRDFGTDIAALRHAARFAVPSPGRRLDGHVLTHVALFRTHTFHGDSGDVGVIMYSSQVLLNAASAASGRGADYATFFAKSRRHVGGPGVDARLTDAGQAILRYHGSYVLVQLDGRVSDGRWRAVLDRIARS
jgi:hypothetical protein